MPTDRLGNIRCQGYRREDFAICSSCNGTGKLNSRYCNRCGGYGEYPKMSSEKLIQLLEYSRALKQ